MPIHHPWRAPTIAPTMQARVSVSPPSAIVLTKASSGQEPCRNAIQVATAAPSTAVKPGLGNLTPDFYNTAQSMAWSASSHVNGFDV